MLSTRPPPPRWPPPSGQLCRLRELAPDAGCYPPVLAFTGDTLVLPYYRRGTVDSAAAGPPETFRLTRFRLPGGSGGSSSPGGSTGCAVVRIEEGVVQVPSR